MPHSPTDHLEILAQLAREYQQKHNELEAVLREAQPGSAVYQLKFRAELTTDRFRAAQQALLSELVKKDMESEAAESLKPALALCRCFDEMRILFQALLDYSSGREGSGN
jgi:hypothetical protein